MKFQVIIKRADGSIYWTESFNSRKELNAWLNEEKTRPYWRADFQVSEIDNTAAIETREAAARTENEIATAKRKVVVEKLKALRVKKTRTAADALDALDALIDFLGVDQS